MLRQIAASIAIALVALSVAAIVVAQVPEGEPLTANQGSSEMRVRKLPPVTDVDPKVDVIKLDQFGQGAVSTARLVGAEESLSPPATLPDTQAQPLASSHTSMEAIPSANIQAAKQQAAAQTLRMSSAMQRDLGVVLAADWTASSKVRVAPRRPLNQQTQSTEPERRQVQARPGSQGYPQRPSSTSSLQDKLNGLRTAIIGEEPQMERTNNQRRPAHQPPQVSQGQPYNAQNSAPLRDQVNNSQPTETMEPVVRSNAPEAPGVPRSNNRTARAGMPTLAEGTSSSLVATPQATNSLESSRQRRDPSALDTQAPVATAESNSVGMEVATKQSKTAVVSSEPITPAVPQLANEPTSVADTETETDAQLNPEVSLNESSMASISTHTKTAALPKGDNVLMSVSGPQLTAQAVGPRRIVISQNAEFQVTVKNGGSVEANEVVVSVQLPSWVDVTSTAPTRGTADIRPAAEADQPLLWRIARLEANSSEVLKISLIPRRSQPLDMSVRWTYAQTATNALVEVEEPMLQMVISGPNEAVYGQTKLYNLTLSNPGTGDAQNVVLSLLPLEGKQETPASTKVGTLAHGETKTIQVELLAGKAGVLLVKANASADGGLATEASKEVLVRRANLVIEVVAPEAEYAGNAANFVVRVLNDGNAPAEDVTINAVLPEGAEYVNSSSDGRFEQKQGRVRWDLGSLAAGQTHEYQLSAKLHSPGDNRLHTTVQDKSDLNAVADVQTAVIARADLKLVVTDPKGPVPVGEEAVYELTIHNRGTQSAEAIEAVIFFSEGIEPIRVEGGDHEIGSGQVVFKTIPQIAANGDLVLKVTSRADRPGNHVFRAEILCRSIGTKLAAEETTHFYGKELTADASQPVGRTASRPATSALRPSGNAGNSPSPLPPAQIQTK